MAGEVTPFQHVANMLYSLVDGQQLSISVEFLRKEAKGCQVLLICCCITKPMAEVEASATRASGADWTGCTNSVERDKLVL